ncbi:MAG TPA: alpha-galactosidase, partial [Clostridia bacterium]|nr:alpha-galactosidase [Clostridia bacterium]
IYLTAYYDCDVIAERIVYLNENAGPVVVRRAMSAQLDLPATGYTLSTFTGAWAAERHKTAHTLCPGVFVNDSKLGASSAKANPFVMLSEPDASEEHGRVYGFNLVYSGNHAEIFEESFFPHTRCLIGINPSGFAWTLGANESFETPEAILSFSAEGFGALSRNFHRFIRLFIVRGAWRDRERPVLVNNWEGTWMDFDEKKLLAIAKIGAEAGAELFVMDDGWFGARDDDRRALGDWFVNTKKLPHGLDGLQKKLAALGLQFGVWVEPEMVNEDSDLFRMHPDWAVRTPLREPALSRNQLLLDLTREEVCNYIVNSMTRIFSSAETAYVKWDYNRNFSDEYTPSLPPEKQGEFAHRYMLGLYRVLSILVARFPNILFESCASGGNRFDLGMLCYMPQIWTSDNTDAFCRIDIQEGTSYGYPPSTMGAHVASSPSQSTLRRTQIETRFNVAAFGLLGYEMDLTEMTSFERKCMKAQIEWYKAHRKVLQFGDFYRLPMPGAGGRHAWMCVSQDKREAVALFFQQTAMPARTRDILPLRGLDDGLNYEITGREQYIAVSAFGSLVKHALPVKINGEGAVMAMLSSRYLFPMTGERYAAGGDLLNRAGLNLKQQFGGTGYNEEIRVLGDYGSRTYEIKAAAGPSAGEQK